MRRGHIYLVFIYQLKLLYPTFCQAILIRDQPTSSACQLITRWDSPSQPGFVSVCQERVGTVMPVRVRKVLLAAVKPILLHSRSRVCAELDPDLLLHLPAELLHRDAGAEPGLGHSGCHRLWTVQTQRSRYNAFINPHYWAYN